MGLPDRGDQGRQREQGHRPTDNVVGEDVVASQKGCREAVPAALSDVQHG